MLGTFLCRRVVLALEICSGGEKSPETTVFHEDPVDFIVQKIYAAFLLRPPCILCIGFLLLLLLLLRAP